MEAVLLSPPKLSQMVQARPQNTQSFQNPTSNELVENQALNSTEIPIKDEDDEESEAETKPPESEWLISIKDKLHQVQNDDAASICAKHCIYRIPKCLRDCDKKAYIPQIVSLGPYYHGQKRLRNMDQHKWRALHHVLKRTKQRIELYLDAVKELEEKARACYEGPICLSSNEFVEMMVLDACFILEHFRGAAWGFTYSRNDPIFAMRGTTMRSIQRDMIMLENQIPFFILETLFSLQSGNNKKDEVAKQALRFLAPLMPVCESLDQGGLHCLEVFRRSLRAISTGPDKPTSSHRSDVEESYLGNASTFDQGGLHCLEIFRRSLLAVSTGPDKPRSTFDQGGLHCLEIFRRSLRAISTGPDKPTSSDDSRVADKRGQQLIHCVVELRDAGIKFKRRNTDRFWDIKFENGKLEIPHLLIQDGTKSLFLNLIAFEQCHLDSTNDITSYVVFMDNLINSSADVSYLHYRKIIENCLGSDAEAAELFNRLCQEVVFDNNKSYLSELSEQVNKYYHQEWNTWRAILNHKYFNSPWSIISFLAAVVLLGLTFAQTFYSVYGYYRPRS